MKIQPEETLLTGAWIPGQGRLTADETCKRVNDLIHSHLRLLSRDTSGWFVLYRDPEDGRLWELSYPQGQMHGGGPPELRQLTKAAAQERFGEFAD